MLKSGGTRDILLFAEGCTNVVMMMVIQQIRTRIGDEWFSVFPDDDLICGTYHHTNFHLHNLQTSHHNVQNRSQIGSIHAWRSDSKCVLLYLVCGENAVMNLPWKSPSHFAGDSLSNTCAESWPIRI